MFSCVKKTKVYRFKVAVFLYLYFFVGYFMNVNNSPMEWKDLQHHVVSFSEPGVTTYSQLLFDVARNQVLVGARNALYRLSLSNLKLIENATWTSPEETINMCLTKGQTDEACQNYVKVLLTNGKKVFACGTNSFYPSCNWREIDNITHVSEIVDGIAKSPYNPTSNITSLFTETGEYFVGGPTDFSGSDFAIYRSVGQHKLRTLQSNSKWLNEPQFVGSFETDKFVYFIFREAAVEYINCGKIIYSRIARVCKNDAGGQVMLKDNWTTFIKARLNCSIAGDYPFYFDEIQSTSYIAQENILYATFTTPANSIAGSAICAFNLTAINNAFSGPFKYQEHDGSTWNKHTANNDHFECKTPPHDKNVIPSFKYQLMDSAVQATTLKPLIEAKLERFTHITIDVLSTKLHSSVHVIYVATQEGLIKKLTVLPRTQETCLVEVWNPVPQTDVSILNMQYLRDTNSIYIGTNTGVLKIPVHHCSRHVSMGSCLNAMDPYCGWYDLTDTCTVAPNLDPLEKNWKQSVTSCPVLNTPVDGGWSSWSEWLSCSLRASTDTVSNDECHCQIRKCNNPTPQNGGRTCTGHSISVSNCTVHGGWTAWSTFSECSATCGYAVKSRTRTCTNPTPAFGGRICVGQDRSEALCTENPPCPPKSQDGGWSTWSSWSTCNCGGFRKRVRRCDSPKPLSGGLDCIGSEVEYSVCPQKTCPEQKKHHYIKFSYSDNRNQTVHKKFKYTCSAPVHNKTLIKLSYKEEPCTNCNNNQWSAWSEWSECSVTCGKGYRTRTRACERGTCDSNSTQIQSCEIRKCVQNNFKETNVCWSDWSPCSVTCGWGIRKRICTGNCIRAEDEEQCEAPLCSSLLGWGEWTSWSECDKNGEQHRKRKCRTSSPGVEMCQGSSFDTRTCLLDFTQNDIHPLIATSSTTLAALYICIGMVLGFFIGVVTHSIYIRKRKPRLPSSPLYISAKSNQYIQVPIHDRSKRNCASTSNVLNNIQNGTLKSCKFEDTIKRNSHLNNGTKMDIHDDKLYE